MAYRRRGSFRRRGRHGHGKRRGTKSMRKYYMSRGGIRL